MSIRELTDLFHSHGPAVVLTGAGISTESGIPDFRSPGGVYSKVDPMEVLSVEALYERPALFWEFFANLKAPFLQARPNAGHQALARLEKAGHVRAVITQNIDSLHTRAGSDHVVEIHGHTRTVRCLQCPFTGRTEHALQQLREKPVPLCPDCGGHLRPDVVLFGDVPELYPIACRLAAEAGILLVVGSSLSVSPANMLIHEARHAAIINRDPTTMDHLAEVTVQGPAGETLRQLAEALQAGF